MSSPSAYLTYVALGEHCLTLTFKLFSLATMSALLMAVKFWPNKLRVTSIAPSMALYLGTHIVGISLSLPYQMYTLFWWRLVSNRPDNTG